MRKKLFILLNAMALLACFTFIGGCRKDNTPGGSTVTDIDGNVYNIIRIGNQEWLDRNLEVSRYRNGDIIPQGLTGLPTEGAWGNDPTKPDDAAIYGKYYNVYAVRDPRGLAPEGWRVATKDDWLALFNELGGMSVAGGKLKKTGTDLWHHPNTDASDRVGFKALPNGYGIVIFSHQGNIASFWSSTKIREDTEETFMYYLYHDNATVQQDSDYGASGYAVRCVRE
jgi:uncharacterized protein (TIGR02145 family)